MSKKPGEDRLAEQVKLIESLLERSGLTSGEMAKRAVIAPETMRKLLRGYQPASKRLLATMQDIAQNEVRQSSPTKKDNSRLSGVRRIPLVGWAKAGSAMDYEEIVDWEEMMSVEVNDPKAIAVRIRGDSMAPRIEDGDVVILACSDKPRSGDTVVARLRDEGVVCKQFQIIDPIEQRYRFISINERYAPIERIEEQLLWIFPVDQLIKRMR